MDAEQVKQILERLQAGDLTADDALAELKWLPYQDLGFARIDTHRRLRTGHPEVVYCSGKTAEQVVEICRRLAERNEAVLATRATPEQFAAVQEALPHAVYHYPARIVEIRQGAVPTPAEDARTILVIAAGTADMPVAEEAVVTATALGSRVERLYDVGVAGLHRLLDQKAIIARANVIIVVAGMEGALPSVVAGMVEQPVLAVPTSVGYGASFQGLSALLTMLNSCATGIAVFNIDNGFGAGSFAHLINR
jgi:hypothetical protein